MLTISELPTPTQPTRPVAPCPLLVGTVWEFGRADRVGAIRRVVTACLASEYPHNRLVTLQDVDKPDDAPVGLAWQLPAFYRPLGRVSVDVEAVDLGRGLEYRIGDHDLRAVLEVARAL